MNHICDRTRWGVIATNFCKNILLEDCTFSRMDTHMGVSGEYTIRRCTFGHMGLNAIGRGMLTVEDSTSTAVTWSTSARTTAAPGRATWSSATAAGFRPAVTKPGRT